MADDFLSPIQPSSFAWPANLIQRVVIGLIATLVIGLFLSAVTLNWVEDRLMLPAEGSLLIESQSGTVYRYEKGTKRAIVNVETMRCLRRPGQHFIRYRALDEIPEGRPIRNREGCPQLPEPGFLVQPIGQTDVYLSTGASLRKIPNERTLVCLANLRPIEQVDPSYLSIVPIGPVVPDGENCR